MMPNGVYSTNFQAVSSVVLSGNNFTKIALFAQFLGLSFPNRTTFNRVQTKCVVPVVSRYWDIVKQSALEEHRSTQVIVSGKKKHLLNYFNPVSEARQSKRFS